MEQHHHRDETLPEQPHTVGELQDHMLGTYFSLRTIMAGLAIILPPALLIGGLWLGDSLRDSMSAYYHGPLRDIFVGSLCAIGVALIAYKGFSPQENGLLNVAGVCAILVALVPVQERLIFTLHEGSAISLFGCCAWVCWRRAQDTLRLTVVTPAKRHLTPEAIARYTTFYRWWGPVMFLMPGGTRLGAWLVGPRIGGLFAAEMVAFWLFAVYWIVKTDELRRTKLDHAILDQPPAQHL